jgi:antitoxin component YwqK of YwqJK toxin-antitoxin module
MKDGLKNGLYTRYLLDKLDDYEREFHIKNHIIEISNYHMGVLHGEQKIFCDDGSLQSIYNFNYGIKEGISYTYYRKGKTLYR